jgi:hypothetical protein
MRLFRSAFHQDYYNEDLDLPPGLIKHDSRRSKMTRWLKRLAAKARRRETKRMAGEETEGIHANV